MVQVDGRDLKYCMLPQIVRAWNNESAAAVRRLCVQAHRGHAAGLFRVSLVRVRLLPQQGGRISGDLHAGIFLKHVTRRVMKLRRSPVPWASLLVLLSGLLAFWAWAGAYTLAPGHIGWALAGIDTQSQYLSWQFFRHSSWQWPLGVNPAYGSDAPGTIVLSDSIPLLALAFKPLSPWLQENFQYLGLWALSCFLLQGWFARKLLRRFTDDSAIQWIGTTFFLTASIFLIRVYMHPALSAQWLLLAGFCLALDAEFRARAWRLLLCIAVLVHAYLFVMLAILWVGDLVQRRWRNESSVPQVLAHAAVTAGLVTLLMWVVGYFVSISTLETPVRTYLDLWFPFWSGNLLVGEWSWLRPVGSLNTLAYDGFGYFGLGFLLLLSVALVSSLLNRRRVPAMSCEKPIPASSWIILAGASLILFAYALGNHVYFAQELLLAYPLPDWLDRLYGVFRGAARMMWPLWYLLLTGSIFLLVRSLGVRRARWILLLCALIQLGDLSRAVVNIRHATASIRKEQGLDSPVWNELAAGYRHVVYLQPSGVPAGMLSFVKDYHRVAGYAATHGLTVNVAYLAREDDARIAAARTARISLLMQGKAEPATFYVVDDDNLWARLVCVGDSRQWYGVIDGLRVIVPKPSPALRSIRVPCAH
jgi:hypothetical protein